LDDQGPYKRLDRNNDKTITIVENLTERFKEALAQKEIWVSTGFQSKASKVYGLPKVQKARF